MAVGGAIVLTAAHAVRCDPPGTAPELVVVDAAGIVHGASVRWRADAIDLAEIEVEAFSAPRATYARPRAGAIICSEHAGPTAGRACGLITTVGEFPSGAVTVDIFHTLPVAPGNSGSGVYDAAGKLVGVITHHTLLQPGGLASSVLGRAP